MEMITFFKAKTGVVIAVQTAKTLTSQDTKALVWLFDNAEPLNEKKLEGIFVGPRREMLTTWSTTAVEITQNMNLKGIKRIEEYFPASPLTQYDRMLQRLYKGLDQHVFTVDKKPEPVRYISDLEQYNLQEGLALSPEEIDYLEKLSGKLKRKLTDSEIFGFSQVNSEHCRHKIFNGVFIIDGKEMKSSLFQMIKKTSETNPNLIVSAYKDNCAFLEGPEIEMFYPSAGDKPSFFKTSKEKTVISLKAETHNFPTTVEPFNGAATGTGGEIRDRMAGGKGSFPIAGTAVYMTSSTLSQDPRKWLYQTPQQILTKASNGASDFGNKFGQSIICGSLLTFEHTTPRTGVEIHNPNFGYDKVIMMAGGVGFAKKADAEKAVPQKGDKIVLLGGDNYRIGMGGGAVSSVNTGSYGNAIELNAIQRANPEMQKRDYNAIRALAEKEKNPIVSVHDHGAGGHLNCLSELVEEVGGKVDISKLPVGDPTLSLKEIIGNESQERMGLALKASDVQELKAIAERERAPFYEIGEATGDRRFTLKNEATGESAIDLEMADMFGSAPKTYMKDETSEYKFAPLELSLYNFREYLTEVLRMESVGCKDWLTNKVDRSVTGLIACQQTTGEIQLPLNNLGVTAIGYNNREGIATSIGHAPIAGLIDSAAGSRLSVAEALTNIVWTPLKDGIKGVSLSANWMWPSRNKGEDARLYKAAKALSDFAIALGINVPTGKDSMSMTQSYPDGTKVLAPGTVIVSAVAPALDIANVVHPNIQPMEDSEIFFIPFVDIKAKERFALGGSALAQSLGEIGDVAPDVVDAEYFKSCFNAVQEAVSNKLLLAGHDISAGGMVTTLFEMCFANSKGGIVITDLPFMDRNKDEFINIMFSEQPGVVVQVDKKNVSSFKRMFKKAGVYVAPIGVYNKKNTLQFGKKNGLFFNIRKFRTMWFAPSFDMELYQVAHSYTARARLANYKVQPLEYKFNKEFTGSLAQYNSNASKDDAPVAAIIREQGSNGDREMAWALKLAGFKVKDVHVTDLISGRETLTEVQMIVFVGGFSNADTLGSAKGWAGAFLYNEKAHNALRDFYARRDTLSLGVCNGCQLMAELGLLSKKADTPTFKMERNESGKFESAFVGVKVEKSKSVLLKSLEGSKLGIWVAHGEGRFAFSGPTPAKDGVEVALRYAYNKYPGNPNGSPDGVAAVCSADGRHLAMMPHPERCLRPWNWAYYPADRAAEEVTPWVEMFINAKIWCKKYENK